MLNIFLAIGAFIVFCIVWTLYAKPKIESFTSGKTPKDINNKIKTMNNDLTDTLNTIKYRTDYEDIIMELETWANNTQLQFFY